MTMSCPSVHELDDGRLLIVGEVGYPVAYKAKLGVGISETAVIVDRALLANVTREPKAADPSPYVICKMLGVKGGHTWVEHDPRCEGNCGASSKATVPGFDRAQVTAPEPYEPVEPYAKPDVIGIT